MLGIEHNTVLPNCRIDKEGARCLRRPIRSHFRIVSIVFNAALRLHLVDIGPNRFVPLKIVEELGVFRQLGFHFFIEKRILQQLS